MLSSVGDKQLALIRSEHHLQSIELTMSAESSPLLGLKWIIDCGIQVCGGPRKERPQEVTQRVTLYFVQSVCDPMETFAPFIMQKRMLLNRIWFRFGQSCDNKITE